MFTYLYKNPKSSICNIIKIIFKKLIKIQLQKPKYVTSDYFCLTNYCFCLLSATIEYFKNNYSKYFFHKNHKFLHPKGSTHTHTHTHKRKEKKEKKRKRPYQNRIVQHLNRLLSIILTKIK